MSGNYPDGFNQRMHDDYFDRSGPDPECRCCGQLFEEGDEAIYGYIASHFSSMVAVLNPPAEPPAESEPHRE